MGTRPNANVVYGVSIEAADWLSAEGDVLPQWLKYQNEYWDNEEDHGCRFEDRIRLWGEPDAADIDALYPLGVIAYEGVEEGESLAVVGVRLWEASWYDVSGPLAVSPEQEALAKAFLLEMGITREPSLFCILDYS